MEVATLDSGERLSWYQRLWIKLGLPVRIERIPCFGLWEKAEAIKLFLKWGADANAKDNHGRTALMLASDKGHTEIVKLLKAHGAQE